jgi:uncharacterized protein (DUF1810 family)
MASSGLERFHLAQEDEGSGFAAALKELRTTGKRGHWIWWILPQLIGLGFSSTSEEYGIQGAEEAAEYLRDPVLRSRLTAITQAVAERLDGGMPLESVMGSAIDVRKLVSSLTLFEHVSRNLSAGEPLAELATLAAVAAHVLAHAEARGISRCEVTWASLGCA